MSGDAALILAVAVLLYLFACGMVGDASRKRGHGTAIGFCASLFFSPIFGALLVAALPDRPEPERCAECDRPIRARAYCDRHREP